MQTASNSVSLLSVSIKTIQATETTLVLKGSDDGTFYLQLCAFWALYIVKYSKKTLCFSC
jgi:hypothetical protein